MDNLWMKWSGHCDNKAAKDNSTGNREHQVNGDGFPLPYWGHLGSREGFTGGKTKKLQELTTGTTRERTVHAWNCMNYKWNFKKKVRNQTKPTKQTNKHMEMNERTPRRLDMGKWTCVQRRLKTKAESQVKSHFNWRRNYRPDGFWAERSQWRFKMAKPCQTPVKHSFLHTWLALQAGIL